MAPNVIPENVGNFISDHLAPLQRRADAWRSYYSPTTSLSQVVYWLLQFGDLSRVRLAYRLLEQLNFLDEAKISHLLSRAVGHIPPEAMGEPLFCPIGKPYDSAGHISYGFAKHLGYTEERLNHLWTDVNGLANAIRSRRATAAVFIDDNLTSGTQLIQFLSELVGTVEKREHVTDRLTPDDVRLIKTLPVYFAVAVDMVEKPEFDDRIARTIGLASFRTVSGERDYKNAFEFGGAIWDSPDEALLAKQMVERIASDLLSDKGWPVDKVNDRLLGYGNLGKLVCFSHNIPKALPAVFWKYGVHAGRSWFPLFPERSEWQRNRDAIQRFEPYMEYFAGLVSGGQFGTASPVCRISLLGALSDGENVDRNIGDQQTTDAILANGLAALDPIEHLRRRFTQPYGFIEPISLDEPSEYAVAHYNREVDEYNVNIREYKTAFPTILRQLMRVFELVVRVRNEGTAPATEVILRLELPTALDFLAKLPSLPSRPEQPDPPKSGLHRLIGGVDLQSSLADSISRTLRREELPSNMRLDIDDGRKYLTVFIRKVLQHTFRDVTIKYLLPTEETAVLKIPYALICEQASRPVDGALNIRLCRTNDPHADVQLEIADKLSAASRSKREHED